MLLANKEIVKGANNKSLQMKILVREAKEYSVAEHGDSINLEYINSNARRGRVGKSRENTLATSCNHGVLLYGRVSRLTPRECFRFQGWPDDYFDRGSANISDKTHVKKKYGQKSNFESVNIFV